jgi:uncharacterized C2H2 Zn-finger protein
VPENNELRHLSQTVTQKRKERFISMKREMFREILPVLVPCQPGEAHDGIANFILITESTESGRGTHSRSGPKVRLLRNRDISEQAIRKVLGPQDYELLTGTLDLKKGCETNDLLLQERAYQKLLPHLDNADLIGVVDQHGRTMPQFFAASGWAYVDVPKLATAPMQKARLVLWQCSGKFLPAIYCPNLRAAIFVRAFLTLQTCPHCGMIFIPNKGNVIYCSPAHSHAHRMARSRANKERRRLKKSMARNRAKGGL